MTYIARSYSYYTCTNLVMAVLVFSKPLRLQSLQLGCEMIRLWW